MGGRADLIQAFDNGFVKHAQDLYNDLRETRYKPALGTLRIALEDLLNGAFDPTERLRLRVEEGRIKQFNRLLVKASSPEHRRKIRKPEDIFRVINDTVGIRITCNVTSDVRRVCETILRVERTKSGGKKARPSFRICKNFEPRDYVTQPKDSGYRGYHIFVEIDVPSGGRLQPVICEIQVRTLLQDAWGELTHEDTYKVGMAIPELVASLSKRLATVLAVMDEIAQDIRGELDRALGQPNGGETRQIPAPALAVVGGKPVSGPSLDQAELSSLYTKGHSYLGEVIYVGWDYALIQLPPGRTGILHWSKVGEPNYKYVDVREYVSVGDTVEVRVEDIDDQRNRIELSLVR
jgi:ppGpp synthetase/RelA/SpoT-type nucleotidyltranferase